MLLGKKDFARVSKVACFVSPHGFGHAARASAVMNAIWERNTGISFEIFTTVPKWFFAESLTGPFQYHALLTDVGLAQKGPFSADLPETLVQLKEFLPFDSVNVGRMAEKIRELKCEMILCDISPLGIAAAKEAGIPSVLVENFTWDWVYHEYVHEHPGFRPHIEYLTSLFSSADFHIQAAPVCLKKTVHLLTTPISRRPRSNSKAVRNRLSIPGKAPMVLITMGGIPKYHRFIDRLSRLKDVFFVVPGVNDNGCISDNVILLPHHSGFFHPDLVQASDAVVGKVGYSTLAEVYHAGIPFAYIKRSDFRESEILAHYIEKHMSGFAINEASFENGKWLSRVCELLDLPAMTKEESNGADQSAEFVLDLLEGGGNK